MTAAPPPPTPPASSTDRSLKIWMAGCALLTTAGTAIINGFVNKHFAAVANDEATNKTDVRRLEDLITSGDGLTKILVAEVKAGEVTVGSKKAISENLLQQDRLIDELRPLVQDSRQAARIDDYQQQLAVINRALRNVDSVASAITYGQAVSNGIDLRIAAIRELRLASGLPVVPRKPGETKPNPSFGSAS